MSRRRRIDVADLGPGVLQQLPDGSIDAVVSEEDEQRALVAWADSVLVVDWNDTSRTFAIGDYLLAVPNGGARHRAEGGKLKAQGVRAGVPDLFLAVPRAGSCGLWIELKRQRGGKTTPAQEQWIDRLTDAGYTVAVAQGWRAASRMILTYLENTR